MLSNVACSSPGCTNPVVGQCGGYKRSCGSFYCAVHSKEKLCSECSERKIQDDLIEEYYQLARHADNYPQQVTNKWARPVLIIGFVSLVLFNLAIPDSNPIRLYIGGLGLIGLWGLAIYANINVSMLRKKIVADLIATKPNFEEFYKIYKSEKRKDMLRMAGSMAMGLIASAASEAQRSYERQRQEEMIRRAVDNELNRHGM